MSQRRCTRARSPVCMYGDAVIFTCAHMHDCVLCVCLMSTHIYYNQRVATCCCAGAFGFATLSAAYWPTGWGRSENRHYGACRSILSRTLNVGMQPTTRIVLQPCARAACCVGGLPSCSDIVFSYAFLTCYVPNAFPFCMPMLRAMSRWLHTRWHTYTHPLPPFAVIESGLGGNRAKHYPILH